MDKKTWIIIGAAILAVIIVVIIILIKNTRKNSLQRLADDLYVRFNNIKTIPLAFKFTKAQAMAKRNEETATSVQEYYKKYEETEVQISQIQEMLNNLSDALRARHYKEATGIITEANDVVAVCEEDVKKIDGFLEEFSRKDDEQRAYASSLKEKYIIVKNTINENATILSIGFDGLINKLGKCEELFSSSEELMDISDYEAAQDELKQIDTMLEEIKLNANAIPKCVKDTKGVLPVMLDEAKREYALTKQRGVYVDHLNVEKKFKSIEKTLNADVKKIIEGDIDDVRQHCHESKKTINELNDSLAAENRSYKEAKEANTRALEHTEDLAKVESYVRIAYDKDSARYGLDDLKPILKQMRENIEKYKKRSDKIADELASTARPSSEILVDVEKLCDDIEKDKKELYSYKTTIDKSTDGETRATSQLIKLQLVVSEVESKIAEYHLPIISSTYNQDLIKSREYISKIRTITSVVPIDIDKLNTLLDEAIDFIYKFYNNVNNIVGMAVMVENAIVFGNKYRSTFPEVDRELSKAEFQYLNGEYTKALKTAITCMETLFPDNADEKILENV